jgi:Tfp pilus assembly protein PilF/mono/diheme cytochrome c family protein
MGLLLIAGGAALVVAQSSVGQTAAATVSANAPTYAKDVAPILYSQCVSCHHPGGPGPFSLLTYADAKRRAHQIADVTRTHFMPPWLPDTKLSHFVDQLELSERQIQTIAQWAAAGAPSGDLAQAPKPPSFPDGWQLGPPDLVLTAAKPWVMAASSIDQYRNFVFRVPITAPRYVRAIEIRPGNTRSVHHANVLIDRQHSLRSRDGADGQPGFPGMDVTLASDAFDPNSHFIYWKPGAVVWSEPEGMSWELDPGNDLILNMHMQASGKQEVVQPSIGIYFTDHPPTLHPMLVELENDAALDIPAGAADFKVSDDFTLPVDVDVLAVYPHAHYLGHVLDGYATLPDGKKIWLVHIPQWDQGWQGIYRLTKPISLPKGTVLSMRYSYDNSAANPRNPSSPPHRVEAGNSSTDEMAHLWVQVLPTPAVVNGEDARLLLQQALMRRVLEKDPHSFVAHFNLGAVALQLGRNDEAIQEFQAAAALDPKSAPAENSVGAALQSSGRIDEAATSFRRAISLDPQYADAHFNLGMLLGQRGDFAGAREELSRVVSLDPTDANAEANLGAAYAQLGELKDAETHLRRALTLDPENKLAREDLAVILEEPPASHK